MAFNISIVSSQQTIHVPGDYLSIQEGINAANHGDTVLVEEGTYVENIYFNGKRITVASNFLIDDDDTHIKNTIIDGSSASGGEYASVIHFVNGEDTTSSLVGFTLINGEGYQNRMGGGILVSESSARIVSNHIIGCKLVSWQAKGAGIFAASSDIQSNYKIIIENNIIEGDSAYSVQGDGAFGGGIYIQTMNARIKGNTIFDCLTNGGVYCLGGAICSIDSNSNHIVEIFENEIYGNKCRGTNNIGGGIFAYNCILHIIDNHIYKNVTQGEESIFSFAQGGGVSLERVSDGSIISGNLIEKNTCKNGNFQTWAGGLLVYCPEGAPESANKVFVDGNTFRKNKALWGAGSMVWRSNVSYTNNFFDDNYAQEYGGAIYFKGTVPEDVTIRVINNTFLSNASVSSGASIYSNMTNDLLLLNNLFWKNLGADEITVGLANMEMHNCNVYTDSINGEWEGSQNFRNDPMLQTGCVPTANSPCVNSGAENILAFGQTFYAPFHDIRRIKRPQADLIDVGAYEVSFGRVDTLEIDDLFRLYSTYLPEGYSKNTNYPVVINLHGEGMDAQFQMDWSGMNATADEMGFIAVYPDGIDNTWDFLLNDDIDDLGFIDALLAELEEKYSIDNDRIYVCGFSMGGFMTTTLACELSDRITAIATVSGGMGNDFIEECDIPRKMPLLIMHGTTDDTYPYSAAEEMATYWNEHNACSLYNTESLPDIDPTDGCTVEKIIYADEEMSCKVLMYKIIDGDHLSWPGAFWRPDTLERMNMDIDANVEIWNFFKQYRLSDFPFSVPLINEDIQNIKLYPNPFFASTTFEFELSCPETTRIEFYDHLGRQVDVIVQHQPQGLNRIVWTPENLSDGIYYFRFQAGDHMSSGKLILVRN